MDGPSDDRAGDAREAPPGATPALVDEQADAAASLAWLRSSPHGTAQLVLIRCRKCGQPIANARDFAIEDNEGEYCVALVDDEPLGAVFCGQIRSDWRHENRDRLKGDSSDRVDLADQYLAFLERRSSVALPSELPAWCSKHGTLFVDRAALVGHVVNARRDDNPDSWVPMRV